jgi:site-specific recombinase XerD
MTMQKEAFESYILSCKAAQLSQKTQRAYSDILLDFIRFTGEIDVCKLNADLFNQYIASLTDRPGKYGNFSPQSIAKHFAVVRTYLHWLYDQEYIPTCISDRLKAPRQASNLPDALTDTEIDRLYELLAKRGVFRDTLIFELLLDTGLRAQEVIDLNLTDVNLQDGSLKVWGKGRREAIVPIGATVSRDLPLYVHKYRVSVPGEDALFVNRYGTRLGKEGLSTLVRRILSDVRESGKCGPHTLRHTFATQFLKNGGNFEVLRRVLRHSDIRSTQQYVHLQNEQILADHRKASPVDLRSKKGGM